MEAPVKVPGTFDELQERLRSAWVKGKSAGASNTALMNTAKMLTSLFLEQEKNKITPYQQAMLDMEKQKMADAKTEKEQANWVLADVNGDGVQEWVNRSTREVKETGYGTADTLDQLNDDGTGPGVNDQPGPQAVSVPGMPQREEGQSEEDYRKALRSWVEMNDPEGKFGVTFEGSPEVQEVEWLGYNREQTPESPAKESKGFDWNAPVIPQIGNFFTNWGTAVDQREQQLQQAPEEERKARTMSFMGR